MSKTRTEFQTIQLRGYYSRNGYLRLQQVLAMARTLYSAALQERREAYRHSRKQISYKDQQNQLTLIKQDLLQMRGRYAGRPFGNTGGSAARSAARKWTGT